MKIWKCIVVRPNALKSSNFSHSKCYKNHVYKGNYLKLGTYVHSLESLLVHVFRFFENFEILGDFFEKIKKKLLKKISNFPKFSKFQKSEIAVFVAYSFLHRLAFSDCLHL